MQGEHAVFSKPTSSRIMRREESNPAVGVLVAGQFVLSFIILFAVAGLQFEVKSPQALALETLPTGRPTPTATPDWWHQLRFESVELGALPSLSSGSISVGQAAVVNLAGLSVPFTVASCPRNDVQISNIVHGSQQDWWIISGTAAIDELWYWKVELSADGSGWTMLHSTSQPVTNDVLIEFLTTTVPAGDYQLRLTAVDKSGNYPEPCVIGVFVE